MAPFYLDIIVLVGTFIAILGFYFAVMMDRLHITYTRLYGITCLYFLLATGIVIYFNREYLAVILGKSSITPVIVSVALILIALVLVRWTRVNVSRPVKFIERNPHQRFILLDYRYFLSKGFEIVFQQTIVVLLVVLLAQGGFSLATIMILFAIVFAIAHIPLVLYDKPAWGWYYTFFSFMAGFIFPPLILKIDFGFIYSFLVHWLFYVLAGVLFWVYQQCISSKVR